MAKNPPKPWPRLSVTLTEGRKAPNVCQSCGVVLPFADDQRCHWQEHAPDDEPERIVVVLCKECSDRLIDPHPRLYRQLERWEPWPGAMRLCISCIHRDGVDCTHGDLKANGGPGLGMTMPKPTTGMWDGCGKDGRRTGGTFVHYDGPVSHCAGRAVAPVSNDLQI